MSESTKTAKIVAGMSMKGSTKFGAATVGIESAEEATKRAQHLEASKKAGHISTEFLNRFSVSIDEAAAAAADDPFTSRMWNTIARLAGLPMPPGEKDFKEAWAKYGSMDDIRRQYIIDGFFESGYMLHSHTSPYDLQAFFQKASLTAIAVTFITYFIFLSVLFAGLAVGLGCIPETPPSGSQFVPTGFFLISGLSSLGVSQAAECLWVESFAVLAGVYISLPVFGAFVLIRLLDNSAVNIKMSDFVLLTKRDGKPTILFRVISSNGLVHTGVEIKAHFFASMKDEETGEGYGKQIDIDVMTPTGFSFTPSNCAHTVEPDSPLLKYGVIVMDGPTPRWNHKKIGVLKAMVSADKEPGSRTSMVLRTFYDSKYHLVDAHPETGAYPTYVSASIAALFTWRTSEGKQSPASDLSKFNQWEYSKVMTERWEKKREEEQSAASEAQTLEEGKAKAE